jgi:hypothetical protein
VIVASMRWTAASDWWGARKLKPVANRGDPSFAHDGRLWTLRASISTVQSSLAVNRIRWTAPAAIGLIVSIENPPKLISRTRTGKSVLSK